MSGVCWVVKHSWVSRRLFILCFAVSSFCKSPVLLCFMRESYCLAMYIVLLVFGAGDKHLFVLLSWERQVHL
jgi:hypothetical protein